MSKKNKKKEKLSDAAQQTEQIKLDIPEEEIWSYQVEGLAAPHIGKSYKNATVKKLIFSLVIIIAVSLSCFFSIRTVQNDTFEYEAADSITALTKFSNTGYITELDIDYVSEVSLISIEKSTAAQPEEFCTSRIESEQDGRQVFYCELAVSSYNAESEEYDVTTTRYNIIKHLDKKVDSVEDYALNGDGAVKVINIGAEVKNIDPKAFYSCWALERIEVAEANPYYCDIDGVLYNKDKTVIINYPCNHDKYLREKLGYTQEPYREQCTPEYIADIQTYVVPSSVQTIGELCFAYTNLRNIYLPEGLRKIETLGFFKLHEPKDQWGNTPSLDNIYSYRSDSVTDTAFTSEEALEEVYLSLPEGLEYIGSDAFSYNQELMYLYIPADVTFIGHHAFWDTIYKQDGELKGVTVVNVARSQEEFELVETGDQWRGQYDYMLFKKSVDINYSAQRQS